jgi:hypothetical protein
MSTIKNTRVSAAASAILAEGATVDTFARHAAEGALQEGAARQATEAAGVAYWHASREAYALSTAKVAVRTMADRAGVPVADVHALTRLGRVAAIVDGMPSGADCLTMLTFARSRDGQRVGPFDVVAATVDVTPETVAALLTEAGRKDAADRAKAAREAEAKRKAAEAEAEAARLAAQGGTPDAGTPDAGTPDASTPAGESSDGQTPDADAATPPVADTLADAWRNLAAWAAFAEAAIESGETVDVAAADAAMVAVARVAKMVKAAKAAA